MFRLTRSLHNNTYLTYYNRLVFKSTSYLIDEIILNNRNIYNRYYLYVSYHNDASEMLASLLD